MALRRHSTHYADDTQGVASFGKLQLEGDAFVVLGYAVIAGLVLWTALIMVLRVELWTAVAVASLPFLVSFLYILLFVYRKPPAFGRDLLQLLWESNAIWSIRDEQQPEHPLHPETRRHS